MFDLPEKYKHGGAFPESVGGCVDLLKEVRDLRLLLEKEANTVKARENEIKESLLKVLTEENSGAAGKKYRAQRVVKVRPQAEDWEKIRAYVMETGRFDLIQRRLSDKAVTDTWEAGERIPGVGRFNVVELSITKI